MITIKSKEEIESMRRGGKVLAAILGELTALIKPGLKTLELDHRARALLKSHGAASSFLGYKPDFGVDGEAYPSSVCVSVNHEIVHGLPGERVLYEGDIISLDFGVYSEELHTDSARTIPVGKVDAKTKRLIEVTRTALDKGIAAVKPGATTGDIGHAIQSYVEGAGMNVIRELVGHGVGRELHEDPSLPNWGVPGEGVVLKEGMTIALEPMVSLGSPIISLASDKWTYETKDGSLSAHFEDTMLVTKTGAEILTR